MASSPRFAHAGTEAAVSALTAQLNSGFLEIWSGAQPAVDAALTGTKLAKLPLSATAFAPASSAGGITTANANAISPAAALATGVAGYFALLKADDATVVATGSVGTSAADLNLNGLGIVAGSLVSCSAFSITESQA